MPDAYIYIIVCVCPRSSCVSPQSVGLSNLKDVSIRSGLEIATRDNVRSTGFQNQNRGFPRCVRGPGPIPGPSTP